MIPATFARETRYFAPPANRGMSHLAPDRSTASQRLSGRQRLPSLRSGTLKKWLQAGIRSLHVAFATQPLPDRVALAFHELEADQHDAFRRAIGYFLERGYRTVAASEYLAPAAVGDCRLWVTFDDNHRCWHDALPLFDELGIRATFFVNSGVFRDCTSQQEIETYFGRIDYRRPERSTLTTGELVALYRAGHEIGCHSHSHFALTDIERVAWPREILQSKLALEVLTGAPVTSFSWPYGARRFFSPELKAYCAANGFEVIAGAVPAQLFRRRIDPFDVPRTRWQFTSSFERNIEDIRVDGRLFEVITGSSPVG